MIMFIVFVLMATAFVTFILRSAYNDRRRKAFKLWRQRIGEPPPMDGVKLWMRKHGYRHAPEVNENCWIGPDVFEDGGTATSGVLVLHSASCLRGLHCYCGARTELRSHLKALVDIRQGMTRPKVDPDERRTWWLIEGRVVHFKHAIKKPGAWHTLWDCKWHHDTMADDQRHGAYLADDFDYPVLIQADKCTCIPGMMGQPVSISAFDRVPCTDHWYRSPCLPDFMDFDG